jgi:hypothetical protein
MQARGRITRTACALLACLNINAVPLPVAYKRTLANNGSQVTSADARAMKPIKYQSRMSFISRWRESVSSFWLRMVRPLFVFQETPSPSLCSSTIFLDLTRSP